MNELVNASFISCDTIAQQAPISVIALCRAFARPRSLCFVCFVEIISRQFVAVAGFEPAPVPCDSVARFLPLYQLSYTAYHFFLLIIHRHCPATHQFSRVRSPVLYVPCGSPAKIIVLFIPCTSGLALCAKRFTTWT